MKGMFENAGGLKYEWCSTFEADAEDRNLKHRAPKGYLCPTREAISEAKMLSARQLSPAVVASIPFHASLTPRRPCRSPAMDNAFCIGYRRHNVMNVQHSLEPATVTSLLTPLIDSVLAVLISLWAGQTRSPLRISS